MKKMIFAAFIAAMTMTSCEKTTTSPSTPTVDPCANGTLQFVNNSNNKYNVYVNGKLEFNQNGKTSREQDFAKGSYTVKVEQTEGYVLYPTVKEYSGTLNGCGSAVISYP